MQCVCVLFHHIPSYPVYPSIFLFIYVQAIGTSLNKTTAKICLKMFKFKFFIMTVIYEMIFTIKLRRDKISKILTVIEVRVFKLSVLHL
jgi:hypothetical protein